MRVRQRSNLDHGYTCTAFEGALRRLLIREQQVDFLAILLCTTRSLLTNVLVRLPITVVDLARLPPLDELAQTYLRAAIPMLQ